METLVIDNEIAYQLKRNKNYYITMSGVLYSIYVKGAHGRVDKSTPRRVIYGQDKDGYYRCVLSDNGAHNRVKIHQLMVEQFIGAVPDGYVINHKDGDKHNNSCENLEVITNAENIRHAWNMGLNSKEKNPNRVKVDVYDNYENICYNLTSLAEVRKLTGFRWTYVNKIRNGEDPNFQECEFKKVVTGERTTDYYVECYFNGVLINTFSDNAAAGAYFGKPKNSVSSAYKREYSKKLNRYTLTFPNVSTIESVV